MSYQTINKCCPQFSVTLQALWTTLTQRDCKPDGSSSSGISPNLWGKKKLPCNKRHYFVCIFCLGHWFFLVFSWGISCFHVMVGGWELQDLAQQRSQHPAWGNLLHLPLPPLLLFFFFLSLNEAALPSASLPSGAERIRVQSHQRTSASAYE